ncbi:DUF3893 domain-containing protein [Actinospica sp. MGRD01-02]|uniref:DUF3893 domain-containing protein n=1 Tax=Actinospica acidithermotolerans TaxID=2828514 RepID=A0A941IKE1_9ACTN|nr:RNaseH domain-containing protein [Actinospica acidithermotolerans]MBR7826631.1 DUF3893 domain-containing protein [Actinospica acidithermotolerans]
MLATLGFLIPPTELGSVTLYPLTEQFGAAWRQLPGYSDSGARPRTPAYAALATALSAVTGQPVVLMPDTAGLVDDELAEPAVLVTTDPISADTLATAARAWERLIRAGDDADTIGPLLAAATPRRAPLADYVRNAEHGRPQANGWFYRVATWSFAKRLAAEPFRLAGYPKPITWRMDTAGSLWSWNDVVTRTRYRGREIGRAMHKLDLRMITLPGESCYALNILPTFTRLAAHWAGTRTAVMARGGDDGTVLRLPVGHRKNGEGWEPYVRNYAAQVVEACGLEALELGTNDDLRQLNGSTRVLVPGPTEFPLGKGTGTRFDLAVARHAKEALAGLTPVEYEDTGFRLPEQTTGKIAPQDVDLAIEATGHPRARILALYTHTHTRQRMIETLGDYAAGEQAPHITDGTDVALTERLCVRFHHVPALSHTGQVDWDEQLRILLPSPTDPALSTSWLETPWKPLTARQARAQSRSATQPVDHKRTLQRHLARQQIVTQFLRTLDPPNLDETPPGEPESETATTVPKQRAARDYKAENALRDLLFRSGILDTRLARYSSFDEPTLLIGLHLRQQRESSRRPGGADLTQMVEVLTAVYTSGAPDKPWRIEAYDHDSGRWIAQAEGQTAFHTQPIGQPGHARHRDGAEKVREHIEAALRVLPGDLPTAIFVDAEAGRTIWPGLQHANLGQGLLPGYSLRERGRQVAVVSVNTSYGEVPQPVDRPDGRHSDPNKPLEPQDSLYRRTSSTGITTWVLGQASRTYTGFGSVGRAGGKYTRFTVPEDDSAFLGNDWHSFTAVHYTIVDRGPWNEREPALAEAIAELCHQPIAGDYRTKHPVPLHAAKLIDQGHPEYRGRSLPDGAGATDQDD